MRILLAQLAVSGDLTRNLRRMMTVLQDAQAEEWVVFPQGMLGGYTPGHAFTTRHLDRRRLDAALEALQAQTQAQGCHTLTGALRAVDAPAPGWQDAALAIDPAGEVTAYARANLSEDERGLLLPGAALPVFDAGGGSQALRFGVQVGRDLLFPEQWKALRRQGAGVLFHPNNAIRRDQAVWRSLLIARAVENGCFVVSANNAEPPQAAPSLVVAPDGTLLAEIPPQAEGTRRLSLDLSAIHDTHLRAERRDLVNLHLSLNGRE